MFEILSNAEARSISRRLAEKTAIWNSAPTRGTSHLEDAMRRFCGEFEGEEHPHKEITQAIIGEAIQIQKALGPGLLEDAYKLCLAHSLRLAGHKVVREVS